MQDRGTACLPDQLQRNYITPKPSSKDLKPTYRPRTYQQHLSKIPQCYTDTESWAKNLNIIKWLREQLAQI